jgi:hypothetical protein
MSNRLCVALAILFTLPAALCSQEPATPKRTEPETIQGLLIQKAVIEADTLEELRPIGAKGTGRFHSTTYQVRVRVVGKDGTYATGELKTYALAATDVPIKIWNRSVNPAKGLDWKTLELGRTVSLTLDDKGRVTQVQVIRLK